VPSSTARVAVSLGGSTVSGVQRGALHGVRVLPNAQGQWASTSWHGHATGINADAPLAVCSLVCVCVCVCGTAVSLLECVVCWFCAQ